MFLFISLYGFLLWQNLHLTLRFSLFFFFPYFFFFTSKDVEVTYSAIAFLRILRLDFLSHHKNSILKFAIAKFNEKLENSFHSDLDRLKLRLKVTCTRTADNLILKQFKRIFLSLLEKFGEVGAKKYYADDQTANKIWLFVA